MGIYYMNGALLILNLAPLYFPQASVMIGVCFILIYLLYNRESLLEVSMEDTNQLSVENIAFTKHVEKNPFITLFQKRKRHIDENCEKMRTNSPKYFENHPRHLFVLKGNFLKRSNDF